MKGKKTGGKNFIKGQSGNPNGRPALAPELKNMLKLSTQDVEGAINLLLHSSGIELQRVINDPNSSNLMFLMAQAIFKARETGNMGQIDMILSRTIGKVKEKIEHTVLRPSILERVDGREVVFTNTPVKKDE